MYRTNRSILKEILLEVKNLSATIVTRAAFDAALTAAVTTIQTAISDLQAKIAAGGVTTPEDFTAELTTLQGLVSTATAADPGPQAASTTSGS
jgi:hypothetical protein